MPGIVVHTSHRLLDLAEALAARLRADPLPPLADETIVVPTRGLARWLELQLAERHGIAAGLRLPFPGAFLGNLGGTASGSDPFAGDVLELRLFRLLGDRARAAELGLAAAYCTDDPDGKKRFQLATRLATTLDDYQLYRDDLLLRAAQGDDLADQGEHGPWQARLWRTLLRDAGQETGPGTSPRRRGGRRRPDATPLLFPELASPPPYAPAPAHRLAALRGLLDDPVRSAAVLPPRVAVFGASSLPPAFLDLLLRIAAHVPVHLYVPQPTAHWIGDLRRRAHSGSNPLLARLGTQAREFQGQLAELEERAGADSEHVDHAAPPDPDEPAADLLTRLQLDVAAVFDRTAEGAARFALRADDDSLRVHDCHSPQRELEVVRDQILDAFARDPGLSPHEVMVLVPDVATYAPYAEAVFGPVREHLPFHVADRDPASELSLCAAFLSVLQQAQERLVVFDVLHLCEEPAILRRFGLFASEVPVLRRWCERAGIRWGLDAESRAQRFGIPAFAENSWVQGIERMLLGVATGPTGDLVLGMLPAADATTGRDDLLQRFLAFLRAFFSHLPGLQQPQRPSAWADRLDALAADLFLPDSAEDEQALQRLQRAAADLRSLAAAATLDEPLSPAVLRDWLRARLARTASARGFLTGAVTVAAMQPMRTVPARHLFLCGMSDQQFPRRDAPAPFDLLQQRRRPGDRSRRLDDRQLFLDALLAARERLHITYVGHSQKDDSACAPSVVLAELLDWVGRSCTAPDGGDARAFVALRHPLQPWSQRYVDGRDPRLFTYSRAARGAARGDDAGRFVTAPLAGSAELPVELPFERFAEFWRHPSRYFLVHTLRLRLPRDGDEDLETEPFAVSALDRWRLLDPAVRAALRGEPPPRDPLAAARATGLLPVGGLGACTFEEIDAEAREFLRAVQDHPRDGRARLRVRIGDTVLVGDVEGLGPEFAVRARISRLKPKDRLATWLQHLFVAAARAHHPADLPRRTLYFARGGTLELRELAPAKALEQLAALLALYRDGQVEPLPFYERSSYAYAQARHDDRKSEAEARLAAAREWHPDPFENGPGNDLDDAAIALCARGHDPLAAPAFAVCAETVWMPFFCHAQEET